MMGVITGSLLLLFCLCCCCIVMLYMRRKRRNLSEQDREMVRMDKVHGNMSASVAPSSPVSSDDVDTLDGTLSSWLSEIGLQKYHPMLVRNGHDSLQALAYIESVDELKEMGIVAKGHQKLLFGEIRKLNAKENDSSHSDGFYGDRHVAISGTADI